MISSFSWNPQKGTPKFGKPHLPLSRMSDHRLLFTSIGTLVASGIDCLNRSRNVIHRYSEHHCVTIESLQVREGDRLLRRCVLRMERGGSRPHERPGRRIVQRGCSSCNPGAYR